MHHRSDAERATGHHCTTRDALRFYERRGLLASQRALNGYRTYPAEAAQWLRCVCTARSLGFTLAEIEADLPLVTDGATPPEASRDALRRKLDDITRRVEGLTALRDELARRLDETMAACPLRPGRA